jgi:hypothetical protein
MLNDVRSFSEDMSSYHLRVCKLSTIQQLAQQDEI